MYVYVYVHECVLSIAQFDDTSLIISCTPLHFYFCFFIYLPSFFLHFIFFIASSSFLVLAFCSYYSAKIKLTNASITSIIFISFNTCYYLMNQLLLVNYPRFYRTDFSTLLHRCIRSFLLLLLLLLLLLQ